MNLVKWKPGESLSARKLNRMSGATDAARLEAIYRRSRYSDAPNSVPMAVTIVSVEDDYLVCRPLGITDDSADMFVAKPWDLRQAPFDGQTMPNKDGTLMSYAYDGADSQARTVTDTSDDSTEDQVIVPAYIAAQTVTNEDTDEESSYTGSQITVQRVAHGTGVSFTAEDTGYSIEVEWEDMNRAGRAWAEDNGS